MTRLSALQRAIDVLRSGAGSAVIGVQAPHFFTNGYTDSDAANVIEGMAAALEHSQQRSQVAHSVKKQS